MQSDSKPPHACDATTKRLRQHHKGMLIRQHVQADTYRRMKKATRNRWQQHCPATNCLWMHYLADIILNLKKFPLTAQQKKSLRDFR